MSRLANTIYAIHFNLQRECGTSMTIGAGPYTNRTEFFVLSDVIWVEFWATFLT